jgi:hypothetical protein
MRHPHTLAQLYGLPHGSLNIFNTILYQNEFQNPQIFQQTIRLFPEQSTLVNTHFRTFHENCSGIESGTQNKMK